MCGICGIFDRQRRLSPIAAMNNIQRHRGPDDEGYFFANSTTGDYQTAAGSDTADTLRLDSHRAVATDSFDIAFGSRRLAILDLSPAGHMPMSYQKGAYWITYNGEIYNYRELKRELLRLGHTFASDADTEVVLAAYAEWGVDCLAHFNGMFALAIWDARRRRLFCARDRFGIKPLYYYWSNDTFVFASEIKALIQHPAVARIPNDTMIFDYLTLGLSDHTNETFFSGIHSLPPGHFLLVDTISHDLTQHRWWQADINPNMTRENGHSSDTTYQHFADLLEDAVRLRLRSDVPVGSCLSGGLDSSSIVCLANQLLLNEQVIPSHLVGDHQKTFTARYREAAADEHRFSRQVVEQTGAEENTIFPSAEVLWREIDAFVWYLDEPVNSTSQYAQWNVMRLARQRGVTVLLDGQGADEILAGYYTYLTPYLSQIQQQLGLLQALQAGWDISRVGGRPALSTLLLDGKHRLPWHLQRLINAIQPAPFAAGSGLKAWQLAPSFLENFRDRQWQPPSSVDSNGLVGVLYEDLTSTNLPKLLRFEDRNSMAFSLETRLPFLDYRLVEFVFSLPLQYRINNGWTKWILRRSMQGVLPADVCWRRSKLGFPTPEQTWFLQGSRYIRNVLRSHDGDPLLSTYLRPGTLRHISELPDDDFVNTPGLWRLLNLVLWIDLFFNERTERAVERATQHVGEPHTMA